MLARIPEETADERRRYYESRTQDQLLAADNDLNKSNGHSSMRIQNPNRQTRVTFGGPKSSE
jgi:hypothetical protein